MGYGVSQVQEAIGAATSVVSAQFSAWLQPTFLRE